MEQQLPFEVPCIVNGKEVSWCKRWRQQLFHHGFMLDQNGQSCETTYAPRPRAPSLHLPRSRRSDRGGGHRRRARCQGRLGEHAVERPRRDLPQSGGSRQREIQVQTPRRDHPRAGQERVAGRDRLRRRARGLLPLRRQVRGGAVRAAAGEEQRRRVEVRVSVI